MAVETGNSGWNPFQKTVGEEDFSSSKNSYSGAQPTKAEVQQFEKILEDDPQQLQVASPNSMNNIQAANASLPVESVSNVNEVNGTDLPMNMDERAIALNNTSQVLIDLSKGSISPVELVKMEKVIGTVQVHTVTTTQVTQKVEQNMDSFLKE